MKAYIFSAIALLFCVLQIRSQEAPEITAKDSVIVSSWMFGVGWNFIDDSGDAFQDFTTIRDQWNGVALPSRISLGRYWKSGLGLELIGTYNNYKEGSIIDRVTLSEDISYFGIDARLSYDLNKIIGQTGFFDPYVGIGLGYSDANNLGRGTFNAVIGFRTWFSDHWGLDFSSSGKWALKNEASNHIQHAAGVVYRFNVEKELSKKGQEKLALLQEIEKEEKRVQDSILAVRKAEEEARALAERLEREREAARLAAIEAEEAKKMGLLKLQQALDSIGTVYFAFDSSILSEKAKETLSRVAELMEANPKYTFKIEAHADSRGPKKYNQWLSERRANRTVDFLNSEGVAMQRLEAIGYGEERLTNHCADGVDCTREEHKANRRSEIAIKVMDRELVSSK